MVAGAGIIPLSSDFPRLWKMADNAAMRPDFDPEPTSREREALAPVEADSGGVVGPDGQPQVLAGMLGPVGLQGPRDEESPEAEAPRLRGDADEVDPPVGTVDREKRHRRPVEL